MTEIREKLFALQDAGYRDFTAKLLLEEFYYDAGGKLTAGKDGYAGYVNAYDEQQRLAGVTYYGPDGNPAPCKDGYAAVRRSYDEKGNLAEAAYLDAAGRPALYKNLYARIRYAYNEKGETGNAVSLFYNLVYIIFRVFLRT